MDRDQHGKIWTLLGTVTTYLILNAWLVTQQGKISLPGINFEEHTDGSTAVLGLIIGGVLLRAQISVWELYLKNFPGATVYARIPPIAGWTYDPGSSFGKRVQLTFLVLFLLLPLGGLVHLNLEVYREATCERKPKPSGGTNECAAVLTEKPMDHLTTYRPLDLRNYRYKLGEKGIQYYPFWEDWLLLLWHLYLQACGLSLLWRVVGWKRASSKATGDSANEISPPSDAGSAVTLDTPIGDSRETISPELQSGVSTASTKEVVVEDEEKSAG